jgi:hypothetical protein
MCLFINQFYIAFYESIPVCPIVKKIIAVKVQRITLYDMNFAESPDLVFSFVIVGTVAKHKYVIVLDFDITKEPGKIGIDPHVLFSAVGMQDFNSGTALFCRACLLGV